VHSVLVVPGLGHLGDGLRDRGRSIGRYAELDVVEGYATTLVEELEESGVRVETLATHTKPGWPYAKRATLVEANRLVLHLCAGFDDAPPESRNISRTFFGSPQAKDAAEEISESIAEWGQCFVYGHKTANPSDKTEDPVVKVPGTLGIRIEPFVLNGPNADEYMRRLPQLGVCIARAVSGYLFSRSQAKARGVVNIGG
jgi:hypothetical protein